MYFQNLHQRKQLDKRLSDVGIREDYLDKLSENVISYHQTQQIFYRSEEELIKISSQEQQSQFLLKTVCHNLLKTISTDDSTNDWEITKLQNAIKLLKNPPKSISEEIKQIYQNEKDQISQSCLKVQDFEEEYQQLQIDSFYHPLTIIISRYFEKEKNCPLHELMELIVNNLPQNTEIFKEPSTKMIRNDDDENSFNFTQTMVRIEKMCQALLQVTKNPDQEQQ